MKRGRFIVFEGPDFAGKTTLSTKVADLLGAKWTRQPSGKPPSGPDGKRADPEEELGFFTLDRAEHMAGTVTPLIMRGTTVVCDRYFFSTAVYQGLAITDRNWGESRPPEHFFTSRFRSLEEELMMSVILRDQAAKFTWPDLVVYVKTDPKVAEARARGRQGSHLSRFETEMPRIRNAYDVLFSHVDPRRFITVDNSAEGSDLVVAQIIGHTRNLQR